MKFPKNEGGDFKPAPAGNQAAIAFKLVDLGTQTVDYNGETKRQRKIMICWELPKSLMDNGEPFVISARYTLSSHERSGLRQMLESWRGRAFTEAELETFEIASILRKPCLLNVVHRESGGRTYANVNGVTPLPSGMEVPELSNEVVYFSFESPNQEVFDGLSDWLKETISKSPEFAEWKSAAGAEEPEAVTVPEDFDVPF